MYKWMQISSRTKKDNSMSAFWESDFDAGGRVRAGWGAPPPLHKFGLELAEPVGPGTLKSLCPLQPVTPPPTKVETCSIPADDGGKTCFRIVQVVNTLVKKRKRTLTNGSAAVRTDKVSDLLPNQETKKNILKHTNIDMESSPKKFILQVFSDQLKYMGR